MSGKLTKAMKQDLRIILRDGPGTLPLNSMGRQRASVTQLLAAGFLEPLNRLRPGPGMYEITEAGRQALSDDGKVHLKVSGSEGVG